MGLSFGNGGIIMAVQATDHPRQPDRYLDRQGPGRPTGRGQPRATARRPGDSVHRAARPVRGRRGRDPWRRAGARAAAARAADPGEARLGARPHRRGARLRLEDAADSLELPQLLPAARRDLGGRRLPPVRITQLAADPATAIGWILGVYGLLTTLATWMVGRLVDRIDAAVLYWRAMVFATLLTVGMALSPSVWLLGILAALRSIPAACSNTVLYAHAARVLPPAEQPASSRSHRSHAISPSSIFPLLAALVAALAPGAALIVGAASYGAAVLAGLRLMVVTRAAASTPARHEPEHESADPYQADRTPSSQRQSAITVTLASPRQAGSTQ